METPQKRFSPPAFPGLAAEPAAVQHTVTPAPTVWVVDMKSGRIVRRSAAGAGTPPGKASA